MPNQISRSRQAMTMEGSAAQAKKIEAITNCRTFSLKSPVDKKF